MLELAGRYADICFIPPFRGGGAGNTEEGKKKVSRSAERFDRGDKIAFMEGSLGPQFPGAAYDSKEYSRRIEKAVEAGASYYLTTFPRNEELKTSLGKFAKEVIPSFK